MGTNNCTPAKVVAGKDDRDLILFCPYRNTVHHFFNLMGGFKMSSIKCYGSSVIVKVIESAGDTYRGEVISIGNISTIQLIFPYVYLLFLSFNMHYMHYLYNIQSTLYPPYFAL